MNPGGAAGHYYAAQSFDGMPDGRVVAMAWQGLNHGSVWTGNASFPVQQRLVATPDGPRVFSLPIDELASLRRSTSTWGPTSLTPEAAPALLADESGTTYEELGPDRCRINLGSDTPEMLTLYLGLLGVDFEVIDAPELPRPWSPWRTASAARPGGPLGESHDLLRATAASTTDGRFISGPPSSRRTSVAKRPFIPLSQGSAETEGEG